MAATEKFKQDILLKEEAFLREVKAKLTDQLNRLKVEEVALVKLLSSNCGTAQGRRTSNLDKDLRETHASQGTDGFDAENNLNQIPLEGLHSSQRQQALNDYEDQEVDDEEEEEECSYQQHLNAIMMDSQFRDKHLDNEVSRSIVQCILQEEIEEFEDDD